MKLVCRPPLPSVLLRVLVVVPLGGIALSIAAVLLVGEHDGALDWMAALLGVPLGAAVGLIALAGCGRLLLRVIAPDRLDLEGDQLRVRVAGHGWRRRQRRLALAAVRRVELRGWQLGL